MACTAELCDPSDAASGFRHLLLNKRAESVVPIVNALVKVENTIEQKADSDRGGLPGVLAEFFDTVVMVVEPVRLCRAQVVAFFDSQHVLVDGFRGEGNPIQVDDAKI